MSRQASVAPQNVPVASYTGAKQTDLTDQLLAWDAGPSLDWLTSTSIFNDPELLSVLIELGVSMPTVILRCCAPDGVNCLDFYFGKSQ